MRLFDPGLMFIETGISDRNIVLVPLPPFPVLAFVPTRQQNRLAFLVKRKEHSDLGTPGGARAQFLHVCMTTAFDSVNERPAKVRPLIAQYSDRGQQRFCIPILQPAGPRFASRVKLNRPRSLRHTDNDTVIARCAQVPWRMAFGSPRGSLQSFANRAAADLRRSWRRNGGRSSGSHSASFAEEAGLFATLVGLPARRRLSPE